MNGAGPEPVADPDNRTRRWREQRWMVDALIAANGPEFDQPRSMIYSAPAGFEALAEFALVNPRIKKFADMHREYAIAARRREARAAAFAAEGRAIAARESYFIAAQFWACARWPRFAVDELHRAATERLNACFAAYAALAPHTVERVEIPFGEQALPAWLHLPAGPRPAAGWPVVVYLPGMDNNKEQMVALYGDRMLERGVAILAVDGPGQAESVVRGIHVTAANHEAAGAGTGAWIDRHPALDAKRVAVRGVSFGSFFALQWAVGLGARCCGVVAAYVAHEPGLRTLFESASPTFKVRFMMMAGYEDEAAFDRFIAGFDVRPWGRRLQAPILIQAGADDELSPLQHTEALFALIGSPRQLVVYEGHKHVLRGGGAVAMGENPDTMYADWLCDRLDGKPMVSQRVLVTLGGQSQSVRLDS